MVEVWQKKQKARKRGRRLIDRREDRPGHEVRWCRFGGRGDGRGPGPDRVQGIPNRNGRRDRGTARKDKNAVAVGKSQSTTVDDLALRLHHRLLPGIAATDAGPEVDLAPGGQGNDLGTVDQ